MIKLINGRGQIGSFLNQNIDSFFSNEETFIYHTWNIENKSEECQKIEYDKFISFAKENIDKRIIFISTTSEKESAYVKYKQMSESYLLQNSSNCLVLRFPTLIGKGVFHGFKNGQKQPFGEMNIATIKQACDFIVENINYTGFSKIRSLDGHKISAKLVCELVRL